LPTVRPAAQAESAVGPIGEPPGGTGAGPKGDAGTTLMLGMDVLMAQSKEVLKGASIGLVTNQTGKDSGGSSTIDLLHQEKSWTLKALFSPEHGIRGEADAGATIDSGSDAQTGLPVYSLYGDTVRPTAKMLQGIDTLVYDIQDVGARVFTYTSTLLEVMQADVRVVVLDRPDPINGVAVEGPVLDPRCASFVGPAPIALRYGMTIGELARLFNGELGVHCDLDVVALSGWSRDSWLPEQRWVNPSPNLRSLAAATLYPGTVLVEGTNLSEGRGTDRPFEWLGAPWVDSEAWQDRLSRLVLPGVRFEPADRTPSSSKYAGQKCHGLLLTITDRQALQPVALGVALISTAGSNLQFADATFDGLAGTDQLRTALQAKTPVADIVASWQPALEAFKRTRAKYLLY
jgi:uncharacterized protein YbbC (DUF1343 family)